MVRILEAREFLFQELRYIGSEIWKTPTCDDLFELLNISGECGYSLSPVNDCLGPMREGFRKDGTASDLPAPSIRCARSHRPPIIYFILFGISAF